MDKILVDAGTRRLGAGALALAVTLAGCGGDSGSAGSPPPPAPSTLSGTAAGSAALADAEVAAKCASGGGTARTDSAGHYAITLQSDAALPCALEATLADGSTWHAVAQGSGAVTAHITPITELVVASLTASAGTAAWFAAWSASSAAALTDDAVASAAAFVGAVLADAGVPAADVAAPMTATLAPGASSGYGGALVQFDAMRATGGIALPDLASAVVRALPSQPAPVDATPSLAPAQLLGAPAATCAALRSGHYRILSPKFGLIEDATEVISIDASTLTVTYDDGSTEDWTANGTCRFTAGPVSAPVTEIVVSQAGVLVARHLDDDGIWRIKLGLPLQTHALDELAGDWIGLSHEEVNPDATGVADARYQGAASAYTVDAAGTISAGSFCPDLVTCTPTVDALAITKADDEGFVFTDTTAGWSQRLFAFRSGSGELMGVAIADDGTIGFDTRARTLGLPAVGAQNASWNFGADTTGAAPSAINVTQWTAQSVDAAAGSWTRVSGIDGRTETLLANAPRDGYVFRAAQASTLGDGTPVTIREFTNLGLRGSGLSVQWLPTLGLAEAPGQLGYSVAQP